MTFFQYLTIGILALFMGIMALVTFTAYSRPSGSTGQNMAQIQKIRYESQEKKKQN